MLVNIVKVTLFHVILVIAFATSQPFQSLSTSSRRGDFEWNTRKIGAKKVATISIRKEEERDRRSVVIAENEDGEFNVKTVSPRRHHHYHHHQPSTDAASPGVSHEKERSSYHYHRHHRGEGTYPDDIDWLTDGALGRREYLSEASEPVEEILGESDIMFSGKRNDISRTEESLMNSRKLQELLSTVGLDINAEVFRNVTQMIDRLRKKKEAKKTGQKKKKRSKKVKRDKKKKGKKNKKKERKKKCKLLKGKEKKKCRAQSQSHEKASSMSGSEACQYHNLEECSRKVGFLELPHESMLTVVKCRYREQFFDCMEELRLETCDPNFKTQGDMKALRKQIRQAIHTTNSCLISEVVEG